MEFGKIIISETAAASASPQDIVNSNISVVNLMREEKIEEDFIHPDALMSYYLDYYTSQYTQGNFAQFVYNSAWNLELNELIAEALELVGAPQHLALFQQQCKKVQLMSTVKRDKFFKGKLEGVNPIRDLMNHDHFFEIEENLVALNAAFLQSHPDTQILSVEAMFAALEEFLGHQIQRA
ncbi:DMP19 family protein [Flavobacterium crassostreae]|uniref:DNA mimic protein DMP19 C-terminal domain-containing protein n=1 Tax=Flavobacterium crassostreae TaxID=1763534 RepID=A0A1B9E0A6_9FLAO|nr:DUF4375 domain-containing protein [Flavobacterium crassostreae]OCB75382.1 hypothetical protein LPBF_08280 [Flavobacterium crassostreae]